MSLGGILYSLKASGIPDASCQRTCTYCSLPTVSLTKWSVCMTNSCSLLLKNLNAYNITTTQIRDNQPRGWWRVIDRGWGVGGGGGELRAILNPSMWTSLK